MTFARVKPASWAVGEILTSAQMNSLDTNVSNAVDGDNGGDYDIGANGISFTGTPAAASVFVVTGSDATEASMTVFNVGAGPAFYAGSTGAGAAVTISTPGTTGVAIASVGTVNIDSTGRAAHQLKGACEIPTGSTIKLKGTTQWVNVDSRSVTYAQQITAVTENTSARFVIVVGTQSWNQSSVASAGALWVPVTNRATKGTISAYGMSLDGNAGGAGHGALPATMPKISLCVVSTDNALSTTGPTTDTAANVAAYEVAHTVVGGAAVAITGNEAIYLKIEGETGANSVASGPYFYRCWVVIDVTEVVP